MEQDENESCPIIGSINLTCAIQRMERKQAFRQCFGGPDDGVFASYGSRGLCWCMRRCLEL